MQGILPVSICPELSISNFVVGKNEKLLEYINLMATDILPVLYIYGTNGSGKTHLLQAFTNLFLQKNLSVVYFNFKEKNSLESLVDFILEADIVLIDNIENAKDFEQKLLFDIYNHSIDNFNLIIVGNTQPINLLLFPDLKTRLQQVLNIKLFELSDELNIKALNIKAQNKNIDIADDVFTYLQKNYSRNLKKLMAAIDILDKESLLRKKRIGKKMVKDVLLSKIT